MKFIKGFIKYFSYLLKHKYYVGCACFRMGLYWQGLVHDYTKFYPREAIWYMRYYSLGDKSVEDKFNKARLHHQNINPHHRQYWVLIEDVGNIIPLEMPERYIKEMLCDWRGVGRCFAKRECKEKYKEDNWREVKNRYKKNKSNMFLHESTENYIENFLFTK